MGWLTRETARLQDDTEKKSLPSGVWEKCPSCGEIALASDLEENHRVCPACNHHQRLPGLERVELLIDADTFYEWDHTLSSKDPLRFDDGKKYSEKLLATVKKTRRNDAIITGVGHMDGRPVAIGVLDFGWMGGSMGTVVGERLTRLFLRAAHHGFPVVVCSSSGGARMHEGILSLMQMAKTSAAIAKVRDAGVPYISVLCDPTTGGVAASFAMLGDIHISEPGATIGFAGRRVIENTIRQKLPEDFQTAEFCLQHGMLDRIARRSEMKDVIVRLLDILLPRP